MFRHFSLYGIMWENIVESDRLQCSTTAVLCINKARHTHTEYAILIAFKGQQWLRERACILRYTYIACLAVFCRMHAMIITQVSFRTLRKKLAGWQTKLSEEMFKTHKCLCLCV
jgi:hypothetical protein